MPETEKHHFSRRLSAFASATLISRVLGYVRDALVATFFGGGLETDAFYAAFKVPNLIRRFLGEGSMTAAFIPVFTDVSSKKGREEAQRFIDALVSGLLVILLVITGLGILFAPQVTRIVAWGFEQDPAKFALTTDLVRLTFPFIVVVSFAALITAVLNSRGRFFVPAVAPSGLSIGEIAFILVFAMHMDSPVHGLALSAVVGGAIHLLWQLPSYYKDGYHLKLVKPFSHPEVKTVFAMMIPTIVGLGADQINSFVNQLCASFLENGSITALYNSNRVMQLPLALFGIAVASVALPALSKAASQNNQKEFKDLLNLSLRIANYVLIPSFVGLAVLGFPIIQALFQHGKFTLENSTMTYAALVPYALGLPAYSAVKILASAFYARKNTKTPVRVSIWAMTLNVVLNVALMWKFKVAGLAFATAVSAWFQAIGLFILLRKEVGLLGGRDMLRSFLAGSLVGTLMGLVCYLFSGWLFAHTFLALRVSASIGVGIVTYLLLSKIFKIKEFDFFMESLLKRKINA
ncbi:MAG: murein biosynthesis integral membrane protein MurJ [Elusimicrobia bacterium]|nr:murein biosynthesis integral membrane protein MurJ [Candidatus Obscuribacterium magneticum]